MRYPNLGGACKDQAIERLTVSTIIEGDHKSKEHKTS